MSAQEQQNEILKIARRNKWTLGYLAVIGTAGFIIQLVESVSK